MTWAIATKVRDREHARRVRSPEISYSACSSGQITFPRQRSGLLWNSD
jgi:hypothetical protein